MDSLAAEIGCRVRARRKMVGLTQAELANQTGLSRSSITNIEAGNQEAPASRLVALAAALGSTVGQLLGEQPAASLPAVRISTACTVLCDQCGVVAVDLSLTEARARRNDHIESRHLGREK